MTPAQLAALLQRQAAHDALRDTTRHAQAWLSTHQGRHAPAQLTHALAALRDLDDVLADRAARVEHHERAASPFLLAAAERLLEPVHLLAAE